MRGLLDTRILLWWLADDPKLSRAHRAIIAEPGNELFVSAITVAEVAIPGTTAIRSTGCWWHRRSPNGWTSSQPMLGYRPTASSVCEPASARTRGISAAMRSISAV